jgi:hypothetical protein
MKKFIILTFLFLQVNDAFGQHLFEHVAYLRNFNSDLSISYLEYDHVNENPYAIIFVYPYWQERGDKNPMYTYCIDFSTRKWGIRYSASNFRSTDTIRFSVLAFKSQNEYAFQYVARKENITNWSYNNILTIDDGRINNKKNLSLIVTQVANRDLRNPNEIAIKYDAISNKWQIVNLSGDSIKVGYTFNILIANQLSNSYKRDLFEHTVTPHCKYVGYTTLIRPSLNRNRKNRLFATQVLRCNGGTNQVQAVWFDDPTDGYVDYSENNWLLYNTYNGFNTPFSHNAKFNILVCPRP